MTPEIVATHFHLRPGDKIGDFGAGAGNFLAVLSRLVGPKGKVYAFEIQKNLVETLSDRARRERLGNVEAVWADIEAEHGTKIADEALDVGIVINTLFQAENRPGLVREITRTLRPGGRFVVVDWTESWGGLGPQPGHVLSEAEARSICESAGLTFENKFDAGGHHYGLAFRK